MRSPFYLVSEVTRIFTLFSVHLYELFRIFLVFFIYLFLISFGQRFCEGWRAHLGVADMYIPRALILLISIGNTLFPMAFVLFLLPYNLRMALRYVWAIQDSLGVPPPTLRTSVKWISLERMELYFVLLTLPVLRTGWSVPLLLDTLYGSSYHLILHASRALTLLSLPAKYRRSLLCGISWSSPMQCHQRVKASNNGICTI